MKNIDTNKPRRVVLGGEWCFSKNYLLRIGNWINNPPDNSLCYLGFRCVLVGRASRDWVNGSP